MKTHGIVRVEWEERFRRRIATVAFDPEGVPLNTDVAKTISDAEIESWPAGEEDWTYTLPEEAADEQLSNWEADE